MITTKQITASDLIDSLKMNFKEDPSEITFTCQEDKPSRKRSLIISWYCEKRDEIFEIQALTDEDYFCNDQEERHEVIFRRFDFNRLSVGYPHESVNVEIPEGINELTMEALIDDIFEYSNLASEWGDTTYHIALKSKSKK